MGIHVPRHFQEHAQERGGRHAPRARNRILEQGQEVALPVRGSADLALRSESLVPPMRLSAGAIVCGSPILSIRDVHSIRDVTICDWVGHRSIAGRVSTQSRSWITRVRKFGKCCE